MEVVAIGAIIILYFLIAFAKDTISSLFPFRVCSICYAVSLTWLFLYAVNFLDITEVDETLIATLMGGSVVGIMYSLEKYFKNRKLRNFWLVRILVISLGFLFTYYFIKQDWDGTILIGILIVIMSGLSVVFVSNSKNIGNRGQEDIKGLRKKLENCCD